MENINQDQDLLDIIISLENNLTKLEKSPIISESSKAKMHDTIGFLTHELKSTWDTEYIPKTAYKKRPVFQA